MYTLVSEYFRYSLYTQTRARTHTHTLQSVQKSWYQT